MAKDRHSQNGAFQLTKGRSKAVVSRVLTLKLDQSEGKPYQVPKEELFSESDDGKGGKVIKYRYRNAVAIPVLNAGACVGRDELVAEFAALIDNIDAYDGAGSLVSPNGKSGKRAMRVAETADGKEVTTVAYLAGEINNALTLAMQKRMYKPLQARAKDEMYAAHPDVVRPAKGERAVKDETDSGIDPIDAIMDTDS